jgi:ribonuclease P protein component
LRSSFQGPALSGSRPPFRAGFGLAPWTTHAVAVPVRPGRAPVSGTRPERLTRDHRLTTSLHYAAVKESGTAFRGKHCLMLVLARAGEPTRFGFIASRKGVGGAVQRNRARRRLREIVRRRWPRLPETGYLIAVVAYRSSLTAPHQELASDVEHLLAAAGALAPIGAVHH